MSTHGRVGPLGDGVGALVQQLVEDLQALVGQPDLVGVGIEQQPGHLAGRRGPGPGRRPRSRCSGRASAPWPGAVRSGARATSFASSLRRSPDRPSRSNRIAVRVTCGRRSGPAEGDVRPGRPAVRRRAAGPRPSRPRGVRVPTTRASREAEPPVLFPTIDFAIFFVVVFTASWILRPWPRAWKVDDPRRQLRVLRLVGLALRRSCWSRRS